MSILHNIAPLSLLNAIICLLICYRISTYTRDTSQLFKMNISLFAWLINGASFYIAIRIFYGVYVTTDPSEVILNAAICVALFAKKGNIARIIDWRHKE